MAKETPKRARSTKPSSPQPDAVQMLMADHKLFRKLFDQYRAASGDEKTYLADLLCIELTIHSTLEEEIFYPAVRGKLKLDDVFESSAEGNSPDMSETGEEEEQDLEAKGIDGMKLDAYEKEDDEGSDEDVIAQAYEEHQMVEALIEQLKTLDPQSSDYQELFTELETAVLEHIVGEEDIILPIAAAQLDVQTLGAAMQRRRDDLSSSLAA